MCIKWGNVGKAVVVLVSLALAAWFAVSWIDVILHQTTGNPGSLNMIVKLLEWFGH